MKDDRPKRLLVCVNPISGPNKPCCGGDRNSEKLANALQAGLVERRIDCRVERIHCLNKCLQGPAMRIAPGGDFMLGVSETDIPVILDDLEALCGTKTDEETPDFSGFYPGG